jgi:antitoxin component YwqK of YwqJK toxin-antitoxin module
VFVRISKSKRKSEVTFSLKTLDSDRTFRKTSDRLKNADYINKETVILIREDEKFTTENKIFRKEIKILREVIFEEKRK